VRRQCGLGGGQGDYWRGPDGCGGDRGAGGRAGGDEIIPTGLGFKG
jgi:hypothetical protein